MALAPDWSRFSIRINVNAPTNILYEAWATREGIEKWFVRSSEYSTTTGTLLGDKEPVNTGDKYKWQWHGYPDSMTEEGEILDLNGTDFFKFSFGKAGNCAITIKQEQGETIVELVQDEIPTDDRSRQNFHVGCKGGWTFYLANLKSLLEGGIDLRNKNEELKEMLNS